MNPKEDDDKQKRRKRKEVTGKHQSMVGSLMCIFRIRKLRMVDLSGFPDSLNFKTQNHWNSLLTQSL